MPGLAAMKPLTALGLLFSGASLELLCRNKKNVHMHMLGQSCAALAALIGGVALLEYSGNLDLDFDLWLFPNAVMADEAPHPGRPAPSAAYCLLLAGIALMTLDAKAVWLAPCMALQILLISLLALVGYFYDISQLYHIGPYVSTALHTAMLLFILALGILSARPERYLNWLIGPFAGSIMAQKLLPIAVLFPFAVGLLQLKGLRSGWYGADFGLALFVTFHIVVFSILIYGTAKLLNRTDAERETSFGAMQESEERFRLLFEASPNGLLMADLEGKVKLANRQSATLFDYSANQLLGRRLETLLRDQAQELPYSYQEPFAVKLLSRAKKTDTEMFGLRRDGSKFIAQVKGSPLVTREGTMLLVTLVDITQRKLAEKDRNRFVALANASMEFIGICDQDFKPFYVNPAGMQLVGLENSEAACAVRVQDYFFPEDQPFITHEFLPRVMKEGHGEVEIRLRHFQTGEAIWILYNVFNLRDENGHITGWATISRDITERKHMEEFLQRERSLLVSVMQATDFKLAFLDTRFNFVWVNPAYANTCRMKPEEMVGKNYFALYPDTENETIFQHVRDTGEAVFYKDKPFVFPDQPERGTTYWDWSFTPVKEANGSVTGLVLSLRETTRFMKSQEALRESEERLNFALETSHTGAWELDLVDHTAHRSLEHDRIFGYDQLLPEWTYEMFLDHVLPEDRKPVDEAFRTAMATHSDWSFECRIRRADGEVRWIWAAGRHRKDDNEKPRHMVGIVQDITERKLTEEARRNSELHFRQVVESLPQLLWTCQSDGLCDYLSPQWIDYTGIPESQQLGYGWLEQLHPDDRQRTVDCWQATIGSGGTFSIEFRIRRHDGIYRWFHTLAVPLREESGRIIKWFGSNTDIDESKRTLEALHESEERLRLLVEGVQDYAIFMLDPEGHVASWNDGAKRTHGYEANEIIGQHFSRFYTEEDKEAGKPAHELATAIAQVRFETEGLRVRKDGSRFWANVILTALRDSAGKLRGFAKVTRDITEKKLAEEKILQINAELERRVATRTLELESANARLKNELIERERAEAEIERFFTMSADLICIVDMEGNFRRVNAAFEATLGYSFSELAGRPILDFVHPDELETTRTEIEKLARGLPSIHYENRYRCKNGFYKWLGWTMQPAPHGELYAMARDITERKLYEERITASLQEKEVLLKEIHHRVKNNLQVIASLLRLQADSLSDPSARAPFLDSQQRVHSMALAHEHLYQSHGLASIHMAEYISSLVNSTRRTYNPSFAQIKLRIEVAEIELDIEQAVPIGLIISELVSNSFKHAFTPPINSPGELWVKLAEQGLDGLMLEVGDNGRGIPDSVDVAKPLSMGLHLVHSFVLQLKGQLTVQRRPETVFSIFIPKK